MNGLVQLQDKIVARFALTIYPYSLAITPTTSLQFASAESLLTSHYVQNEYASIIMAIKDSTRAFDNLTVVPTFKLRWF